MQESLPPARRRRQESMTRNFSCGASPSRIRGEIKPAAAARDRRDELGVDKLNSFERVWQSLWHPDEWCRSAVGPPVGSGAGPKGEAEQPGCWG